MILRRLAPYFKRHWARFSVALLAMAGVASLTAAAMWMLKEVVDKALTEGDLASLRDIVILVLLLYFMKAVFAYVHDYLTFYVGNSIVRRLRDQLYAHLQTVSMEFFSVNDSARLVSRLTVDVALVQSAVTKLPVMVVRDGLTIVALAGFLIYLHWKFALLALVLLPVAGGLISRFGKSLRRTNREGQAKMSDLYAQIQETMVGAAVVRAFQREGDEIRRFENEDERYFNIAMRNARTESLSSPVMEFWGALGVSGLLWLGGVDVINGVWSTGEFFAFVGSALSLYQPVKNFARSNATLQQAVVGAERIFQLIDVEPSVKEKPDAVVLPEFGREVRFEKVSFAYKPPRMVLQDVDLAVPRGARVALVGPSGSGKTTIGNLLLRFYDVTSGCITIDGVDIKDASLKSVRSLVGVVGQDTMLFNMSVRENVGYGKAGATDADIQSACEAANAWEFIEKLPHRLDTVVGERGITLSGGQRQRIAIARALLKNPPILLLDEATSALDAESERLVQEALERLMASRTVVVIAHRLSTVRNADMIVALEAGRVVESGTHARLIERDGLYRRLHDLQLLEA